MSFADTAFNPVVIEQRVRLFEKLRRFVKKEDVDLNDHAFVMAVFKRYAAFREIPLIDPNE